MPKINNSFLLPKQLHSQYANSKIEVLPVDFAASGSSIFGNVNGNEDQEDSNSHYDHVLNSLNSVIEMATPDIIFEDSEILSTLIAEKNNIPRISIYRTGIYRSKDEIISKPAHRHSLEKTNFGKGIDVATIIKPEKKLSQLYHKHYKTTFLKDDIDYFMNYLNAKTKLIPGIPSIEILPDDIKNRDSYFYTGPLLVEDSPTNNLLKELNQFFDSNKNRKSVFITTGLIDQDDLQEKISFLLSKGYAVISTRKIINTNNYRKQFIHVPILAINYVCSKVDLIIHHGACGTYHYPLLHQKPSITIGTRRYDQEGIALRLQHLKLSKHVPSVFDDHNHTEIFRMHIEAFEKGELCDYEQLKIIKEEIYRTMLDFDIDDMLDYTINK